MSHGRRRGLATWVNCNKRAFITFKAAAKVAARMPDEARVYRGKCCGHYHITRLSLDEWSQKIGDLNVCTPTGVGGMVVSGQEHGGNHEEDEEGEPDGREPEPAGDAG